MFFSPRSGDATVVRRSFTSSATCDLLKAFMRSLYILDWCQPTSNASQGFPRVPCGLACHIEDYGRPHHPWRPNRLPLEQRQSSLPQKKCHPKVLHERVIRTHVRRSTIAKNCTSRFRTARNTVVTLHLRDNWRSGRTAGIYDQPHCSQLSRKITMHFRKPFTSILYS